VDKNKIKLGIAPIAWTNDDLPELGWENTFEQCISEMALAGFTGSEVGNKYPRDPKVLHRYLASRHLSICNAWFSTFFANNKTEETYKNFIKHRDFLHAMGAKVIGCSEQSLSIQGKKTPVFGNKPEFNDKQWQSIFNGYDQLAEFAADKGMRVCLHHHMGTGIQTPEEIDRFMDGVGENVYLLFDTGHIYFSEGKQSAVNNLIKNYVDRVIHVHLKDIRESVLEEVKAKKMSFLDAVKAGVFTVPGDGVIEFNTTFKVLDKAGYEGWLVVEAEQDPAKANPYEYALKARAYIRANAGI